MQNNILRVIIPTPLWQVFDYLHSDPSDASNLQPGMRIKVPFGAREVVGILLEVTHHTDVPVHKLKKAIQVIDDTPLIPATLLTLYQWASDYYHFPLGEIVFGTLPKALRVDKVKKKESKSKKQDAETSTPLAKIHSSLPLSLADDPIVENKFELNPDQKNAIDAITQSEGFQTFLLAGITGSGKTEVYIQCITRYLKQGKQALVLVPEIALTPQTLERFQKRFDVSISVIHSGLTDRERKQAWNQASLGHSPIIIGTRSAIFTPLKNPGMIILDEEHDSSFKQQSGFRYSARDLAIVRAQLEKIPVVLGSATPSLESLYNTERKRYRFLQLPNRAGNAQLPVIKIIDICNQKLQGGLSKALLEAVETHLSQNGQVLLFLNRRGFAPVLMCHRCGWIIQCKHCDARLTLHNKPARLFCHHCGANQIPPRYCEKCQQAELISLGSGTERIEQVLQKKFPNHGILRVDRDSIRGKGKMNEVLEQMYNDKTPILVGTQMLAKGHHLPNLSLVAIVDADSGLFSIDFRATERMGQLLLQVAGRAGRENKAGEVYLQTHQPQHPLLKILLQDGYFAFAGKLLSERKAANLPPYCFLTLLRAEAISAEKTNEYLEEVKQWVLDQKNKEINILGPIPAPMERKAGKYRAQLLFQAQNRIQLQRLLQPLARQLNQFKSATKVRWSLDVDPMDMI